jgi:cyclic pyranopterin phosphate synthase
MELSHVDERGQARMVDVTGKNVTNRRAVAIAHIRLKPETIGLVRKLEMKKGDVLATARIAGIMAAKKTSELIPLCHPLMISSVTVDFEFVGEDVLKITSEVRCHGPTGVEMEALTSASVAALTVYDMCKAVDKGMTIEQVYVEAKEGGKSGEYRRQSSG